VRRLWNDAINLLSEVLNKLERDRAEGPSRDPTKWDFRFGGLWLTIPVFFSLGILVIKSEHGRGFFETAGPGLLWLAFVSVVIVLGLATGVYMRRVSIKHQLVVDLIAWSVLVWMYFQFRLWDL
jgi:hypothetical protein